MITYYTNIVNTCIVNLGIVNMIKRIMHFFFGAAREEKKKLEAIKELIALAEDGNKAAEAALWELYQDAKADSDPN